MLTKPNVSYKMLLKGDMHYWLLQIVSSKTCLSRTSFRGEKKRY